jgi:Sec-independent protein translocase protein TatA
MSLGVIEILVVLAVFLIFGPRRITSLVRALGRGTHDFFGSLGRDRKGELADEESDAARDEPRH